MAQQHQRPMNNMFKVWQNLPPFSSRPNCGVVEAPATKVVNQQLSILLIVVFFIAAAVSIIKL
jgi:hypothetical protein